MDYGEIGRERSEFESLLEASSNGSHRVNRFQSDHPKEGHGDAFQEVSRIIDSLPVLGILSEIGFKEGSKATELQEDGQETIICKTLEDMDDHIDLQDDVIVDICPSYFTAEYVAHTIMNMIKTLAEEPERLLSVVKGIAEVARSLINCNKIEQVILSRHLLAYANSIPLSILIALLEFKLVFIQSYISELYKQGGLPQLHNQLLKQLKHNESTASKKNDAEKIGKFIISLNSLKSSEEFGSMFREQITNMIYSIFEELDFSNLYCKYKHQQTSFIVMELGNMNDCYSSDKTALVTMVLEKFLFNGAKLILDQAFIDHFKWLYSKLQTHVIDILQELLLYQDNGKMVKIIKSAMRNDDLNFQRLLSVLSVWLISVEGSQKEVLALLHSQLAEAFELHNPGQLKICLLVARHCSLENLSGFPTYSDWFSELTSSLPGLLQNDKSLVNMFMSCLKSLLPVESKLFLKIQLSNVTKLQSCGKNFINEYITVAKTRINDLKDTSLEKVKFPSVSNQVNDFAVKDVEKALGQYALNSKIPTNLLEVSVFRKSYFIGSFLPALLIPGLVRSDPNREKFVDDLTTAGKIPTKVLQTYKQACEAFTLEEEFSSLEAKFEDLTEIVLGKISELSAVVLESMKANEQRRKRILLQSYVSSLSTHLSKLYLAAEMHTSPAYDDHLFEVKIIDTLVDSICSACSIVFETEASTGNFKWVKYIILMLKEYHSLQELLETKIVALLGTELANLENYHLHGIARIVSVSACPLKAKGVRQCIIQRSVESILAANTPLWLHCALQFITDVLLLCSEVYSDVVIAKDILIAEITTVKDAVLISECVIKHWTMIFTRAKALLEIIQQSGSSYGQKLITSVEDSVKFAESVREIQAFKPFVSSNLLCLEEWLEFELSLQPQLDILTACQKQEYYYHVINTQQCLTSASANWQFKEIAVKIVHTLLDSEHKSTLDSISLCAEHQTASNTSARSNSFNDMLTLLQSLNQKMSIDDERVGDHIDSNWLLCSLGQWVSTTKNTNNTSSKKGVCSNITTSQVSTLCCILRALPSFALFSSTVFLKLTFHHIDEVSGFVHDFASLLTKNSFTLPLNFAECLLDAVIDICLTSLAMHSCSISDANANMIHFFASCPMFCISIVNYLETPNIRKRLETGISRGFYCFRSLIDLQDCLRNYDIKGVEDVSVSNRVIGVCLFNHIEKKLGECHMWVDLLMTLNEEILLVVFECLMLRLCFNLIGGPRSDDRTNEFSSIILQFFKKTPNVVVKLSEDVFARERRHGLQTLRGVVASECILKMYPVAFLKIFAKMDPLGLQHFASHSRSRDFISKSFKYVNGLFAEFESDWPKGLVMEPFSLSFIKEIGILERRLQIKH